MQFIILKLVLLAGTVEWTTLLGLKLTTRVLYVIQVQLTALVCAFVYTTTTKPQEYLFYINVTALSWWLFTLAWIAVFPTYKSRLLTGVAGVYAIVPAMLNLDFIIFKQDHNVLIFMLTIIALADAGAFFVGRFTTTKNYLAPFVSPKKTWQGVFGGYMTSLLFAVIFNYFVMSWPYLQLLIVTIVTVTFAIVGDLAESMFKRHAGIKDTGNILPGHGGILDRIDSFLAAAPVFVLLFNYKFT